MRWAILVSAVLLLAILAIGLVERGDPGMDPRDQLTLEAQREAVRGQLAATHVAVSPAMACAASHVAAPTAETLYRDWVNSRRDLVTPAQRDDASADLERSITSCGGVPSREEDAAHSRGMALERAAALAMLAAGR